MVVIARAPNWAVHEVTQLDVMYTKLLMMSAVMNGVMAFDGGGAHEPTINPRQTSSASAISWETCPDVNTTQCAILDVPMDYTAPNNSSTVSIFLRKYAATGSADKRLGSLLINPGGPGGSGAEAIIGLGEYMDTLLNGTYDIIGFDPRAVNLTGPPTACHDVEYKFAQRVYQVNMQGAPFPHVGGEGETAHVAKLSAIQSSHHAACVQNGNHEMLRNSGTVAVAKDMVKIVEALGEDGLNFLGYSYGTILGATFAAIRPDLVKRMVLDGVSDAEAYFNDILEWGRSGMQDTQKTWEGFIATCIDAGPTHCALAATKDNKTETVEGLTKRLDALYIRFGKEPLIVGDSPTGPGILQAHYLQFGAFFTMYSPGTWAEFAQVLAILEQGGGQDYYPIVNSIVYGAVPEPYTQNVFNRSMQRYPGNTREAQNPIMCGDSPRLNITVEEYAEYFREMGKLNSMGEQLALIIGWCRGWSFSATERFPILFVSSDADPITPLASAVKMSRGFGNESATLLIQQGFGHTSNAHPSLCTFKNIQDYFIVGTVPKNGTHCTPEPGWIYPTNSTESKRSILTERDRDILEAYKKFARSMLPINF